MKTILLPLFAAALCFSSCKKEILNPLNAADDKTYKVTYSLDCTDCLVVFYRDSLLNQMHEEHRDSKWKYTFYGKKDQPVLLFVYNTHKDPRMITATISVNDTLLATQSRHCHHAGYAFVTNTLR